MDDNIEAMLHAACDEKDKRIAALEAENARLREENDRHAADIAAVRAGLADDADEWRGIACETVMDATHKRRAELERDELRALLRETKLDRAEDCYRNVYVETDNERWWERRCAALGEGGE